MNDVIQSNVQFAAVESLKSNFSERPVSRESNDRPRSRQTESSRGEIRSIPTTPSRATIFNINDAAEIKDRVRKALLTKTPYSVFDYYYEKGIWQFIAKHHMFEHVTLGVIAFNALWISIDTDWNTSEALMEATPLFQFMEHAFCFYFSFEWFVRFMAFKRKRDGLKDGWFKFDSALVFMMVVETWIFTMIELIQGWAGSGGGGGSPLGGNTAILRLFRLLRLSRLMRMLKSLPELMILIKGMVTAMKSVAYVGALLIILTYIFGIAFTVLAVDTDMGESYFKTVPLSMYSLILYGTFCDALSDFTNDILYDESPMAPAVLFLVFIFIGFSALTIMNMLIGVLCEVISAVAARENEEIKATTVGERMTAVVQELDKDSNGSISNVEFKQIMQMPQALRSLEDVDVDPEGLVDFADLFFLDEKGHPTEIPFEKFMEMVLDLRATNTACLKDLMTFWKQLKQKIEEHVLEQTMVRERTDAIDQRSFRIEAQLKEMLASLQGYDSVADFDAARTFTDTIEEQYSARIQTA